MAKMGADGVDTAVLDMDPDDPSPNAGGATARPKVKDDPRYAKYFKMLAMHLPKGAVMAKMGADGVDTAVLDMDPESLSPGAAGSANPGRLGAVTPAPPKPLQPHEVKYPKKQNPKPPVPMRALFWGKITTENLDDTVWANLSDESVTIDMDFLVEAFPKAVKKAASTASDSASKKDEGNKKDNKPKEVNILDPKVLQNVGIALAKYRMPPSDIKLALLKMNESKPGPKVGSRAHALTRVSVDVRGRLIARIRCALSCVEVVRSALVVQLKTKLCRLPHERSRYSAFFIQAGP